MAEPLEQEIELTEEPEVVEAPEEEQEVEEPEEVEEEKEEEEKPPSRRESLRIQALVSKLKQAEQPRTQSRTEDFINYKDKIDADEGTISKLDEDRTAYGDSRYNEGIRQAESIKFHTRLEIDAPKVQAKFPVLDKESPKFNPVVADAINTWYLSTTGFDPKTNTVTNSDVRYADFVEGIMELSDEMAGEKVATTTKNIAKQAAATGLRPSGGTAKRLNLNQDPGSMTDEELDAFLAQAAPTKKR